MIALFAPDPEATDAIGAVIARQLAPGDVITLHGDLGAGKTALARAIIRARLGDSQMDVPSPTFALVQPYPGIIHADLYRLAGESEIDELGLFDDDSAVILVEWPERAPVLETLSGLAITLDMGPQGNGRRITIAAQGGRSLGTLATTLAPWTEAAQG